MSQINLDDSDCIIEDQNITCITLDDSQDAECNEIVCDEEETPPPPPAMDQEMEEGEVSDEENDGKQKQTICEIKFPSHKEYEQFGQLIKGILKEHLADKQNENSIVINEEKQEDSVILLVQHLHKTIVEDIPMPPPLQMPNKPAEQPKEFEKEPSPDLSGISELFTIDTAPAPKIDSVKVPSYKRAIKDALLDEEAAARKRQKEEEDACRMKKSNACFNCGEAGHSIRECSRPHNAKRIKNAKKKANFKMERYHVDVEQRFAHLKPGCLSDKLREALGLRKGELPFFFYRMRVLGYPPGWLEDAKVEHSGINLFNSDGTKILHSDEDEGEVDPVNHKYNISKIHDFPGFNQDPGENFYDDYKYHNVPAMNKNQMKDEFIKTLGDQVLKGYKRKKLKDFPNASTDESYLESTILETADMEIEDPETTAMGEVEFIRPPPPTEEPPCPSPPPPPPPPENPPATCESPPILNEQSERDVSTQSPTLKELERQKQRLLRELKSNTSNLDIEDSLIDEIIELDEEDDKREEKTINTNQQSENSSESTATTTTTSTTVNENSDNKTATVIKESFMGTPVLKFSPYDNLPKGDNFKVGVSDVINFENLPDSTGKYEQMKEVIKKVRSCISKIQSED